MTEIPASLVKQLRDATNVSMMECKRALTEAGGDLEQATRLLRERGMAVAAKKATRATNQGLVAAATTPDGRCSALLQVNCETDFVARNDSFKAFVTNLGQAALKTDAPLAESMKDAVVAKVVEIGENIVVTRNTRFVMTQPGLIETYIHLGGKVGVLIELGCGKAETAKSDVAREVAKDLTLHIAACAPRYLQRDEVSAEDVAAERAIYAKQVEGKPAQIVGKIVEGKMQKYFAEVCLVDQGFVKEPKQAVKDLLVEKGKQVGDTLTVRRFVRYQLGQ